MTHHRLLSCIVGFLFTAFVGTSCKTAAEAEEPELIAPISPSADLKAPKEPQDTALISSTPKVDPPKFQLRLGDDILSIPDDEQLHSSPLQDSNQPNTGVIVRPPSE